MRQQALFSQNNLVSAKRGKREREGVHSWHPYHAGYAEAFVESAIEFLGLSPQTLLLDPWSGSGTTSLVASRFEIPSIGCEINPVMNIFAVAKSGHLLQQGEQLVAFGQAATDRLSRRLEEVEGDDPLLEFMSPELAACARTLYSSLTTLSFTTSRRPTAYRGAVAPRVRGLNSQEAFLKAALFVTCRKLGEYKAGSNPTWMKGKGEKPKVRASEFVAVYRSTIRQLLADLKISNPGSNEGSQPLFVEADSRQLPLSDSSVDAVVTSPPYLTRIDYAISTKPELLLIADAAALREIREKTIGAPVIVDKNISVSRAWGKSCNEVLEKVAAHSSKASSSYYLPNMLQYFRDMELSLRALRRVLRPGGRALIVVQSSYFKEVNIPLGEIYVEAIRNLKARAEIASRETVRGHLAHVNTKSNGYIGRKVFYEDVVLMENPGGKPR